MNYAFLGLTSFVPDSTPELGHKFTGTVFFHNLDPRSYRGGENFKNELMLWPLIKI
jgi:hypothetical protein